MEIKSSLPLSQQPITAPNLSQINPFHALPSYFSNIYFNIISSMPGSYKWSLSFRLPHHKPTCTFPPYVPHAPPITFMYLVRWRLVHAPFLPWDGEQRLPASGLNTHAEYAELTSNKQTACQCVILQVTEKGMLLNSKLLPFRGMTLVYINTQTSSQVFTSDFFKWRSSFGVHNV